MEVISKNLIRKFDSRKINFLVSVCGVFGSLYFSEVLKYPPCVLCWYQRIALYPLALIYAIALWSEDQAHRKYAFTFIVLGFATALYHNLLYYGVIDQAIVPCSGGGVSCTSRQLRSTSTCSTWNFSGLLPINASSLVMLNSKIPFWKNSSPSSSPLTIQAISDQSTAQYIKNDAY